MRNKIYLMSYNTWDRESRQVYAPYVYRIKLQEGGLKGWIQRKLLKYFLHTNIATPHYDIETTYTSNVITIDMGQLFDELLDYHDRTVGTFGIKIEKILVGQDVYQKLAHQTSKEPVSFIIEMDQMTSRPKFFCGIPIQIVPWMNGVLFVPQER